jgi:hypothetical protein
MDVRVDEDVRKVYNGRKETNEEVKVLGNWRASTATEQVL